ncbi:MAG: hypothetical protein H7Y05_11495 [Steroidobacteraceae bacterium]|nr:hypothetical protein [Deltaproteobacteria bacterium]
MPISSYQEISCQQVLVDDASVFSVQWSVFPASISGSLSAENLMTRYLDYIRSCTLSVIRPLRQESGIEFRLPGSRLSLISFLPPSAEGESVVLRICGGFLVQPRQCRRGELRFTVAPQQAGVRVSLQLSEFCPLILGSPSPSRLRFWLYRLTQATIHRLVTVRFLTLLYRELAGSYARVRVISVHVREGQPV